jgi:hypothetical protein
MKWLTVPARLFATDRIRRRDEKAADSANGTTGRRPPRRADGDAAVRINGDGRRHGYRFCSGSRVVARAKNSLPLPK